MGTTGEKGWYGVYGTASPVYGVRIPVCIPGDKGPGAARVKTVCLVPSLVADGLARLGSYARSGRAPPVRTAAGALDRAKDWPGLGDAGRVSRLGNLFTPGLGDMGSPTRPEVDRSDLAEGGS